MSTTPEGKVKQLVKRMLDEHKAFHNWPVPTGFGVPVLDCFGCHRGRAFMIETKAPGERLTPRQEFTKEQFEAAGGRVFVIGEEATPNATHPYSGMFELEAWLLLHS